MIEPDPHLGLHSTSPNPILHLQIWKQHFSKVTKIHLLDKLSPDFVRHRHFKFKHNHHPPPPQKKKKEQKGKERCRQLSYIQFIPPQLKSAKLPGDRRSQFIHLGVAKSSQINLPRAVLDQHNHPVQQSEAAQMPVPQQQQGSFGPT